MADITVYSTIGVRSAADGLFARFENTSGHKLAVTWGSAAMLVKRIESGETADVLILSRAGIETMKQQGKIASGSDVTLASSGVGIAVKAGSPKPDISTPEALKQTLLAAKSIAYSDSGSGTYLSTTLFSRLGVADQIAGKSRKVRGPPSGEPVAAVVARGEAEIGFQQVAELIHVPGISFVGTIPAEVQPMFVFAGALAVTVRQPEAATALLRFLASPEAAPVISKAGLRPPSDR